jgi:hypothetical protein
MEVNFMAGRKSGCLKVFIVLLVISIVLVAGTYFGAKFYFDRGARVDAEKSHELLMESVLIDIDWDYTAETLPESEYDLDYDGDGLTNKEEIDLGTCFYRSDTDGDGLNDYDEVKIHGSDPLKSSTAGDGVSDAVKVQLNLDFKTPYNPTDSSLFGPIELSQGMTLNPEDVNSRFLYVYEPYEGNLFTELNTLTEPFILHNAKGTITASLRSGFTAKNTAIYYFDIENKVLQQDKKAKFTVNTVEFTCRDGSPMAIVNTDEFPEDMMHSGTIATGSEKLRDYYLVLVPFTNFNIVSVPNINVGNFKLESFVKDRDTVFIIGIDNVEGIRRMSGNPDIEARLRKMSIDWEVDHYSVHSLIFQIIQSAYYQAAAGGDQETQEILSDIHVKKITSTIRGLENEVALFMRENGYGITGVPTSNFNSHSGFDVSLNGFLFSNLSTTVSPNGVCAGFSFISRQAFNKFTLSQQTGTYRFSIYSAPGYQAQSSAYEMIFAGKSGNYPAQSVVLKSMSDNVYDLYDQGYLIDASKMANPDKTVVDMLSYYWLYNNGERITYEQSSNILKNYDYNFTAIEDINREFQSGRVVEMGVFGGIGGHAIVGYQLRQDPADLNLYYMSVYDSNFPENKHFTYASGRVVRLKTEVVMKIRRQPRVVIQNGQAVTEHYFTFDYQVSNPGYRWTNMYGRNDRVVFYKTGAARHSVFVK